MPDKIVSILNKKIVLFDVILSCGNEEDAKILHKYIDPIMTNLNKEIKNAEEKENANGI